MLTPTDPDLEVAVAAASAAAHVLRAQHGTDLERFAKPGGDLATSADLAAERAILDVLRAARPHDAVTGEESGASGERDAPRRWLVDPLCGTLNYAVGTTAVAVNVALQVRGRTAVAAVADPFAHEVLWCDGDRAGRRTPEGDDAPLAPTAGPGLVDLNRDPPLPRAPGFRAARLLTDPAFTRRFRPRVGSTTLALAWVAAGRRAAYVTDGHLEGSVHFAAGIALCVAAGCILSDLDGSAVHSGAGGLVAAVDQATHTALLRAVRDQEA
ncbi:phosphatase [Cellulosimicrobium cellulans]|uniref:Phosphatase n=1 Tax=Cellulosimicrobium cellulans TaxID=1710 RepID=A0A1Y0HYB8_CELCE|nr:inositol monophosphatase family protein [Cellulosimicrobium cellulans]ARU53131.1 phosphatase [Cellulosimicrobium cellulans]